jgi:hypothetical protein
MTEAFIYLWYDAPNKMYYLGKHKGSPDDSYTHSSTIWESFTKDNIPEGVTRRILAYGTDEEMCILEHEFLVNRKKRCWNRYYNESLGDPRYIDMSGENNPAWKGGVYANDPVAYRKAYHQTPERKAYHKKLYETPERKAYLKEYNKKLRQTPEYKAYMKEYLREYHETPEYKEQRKQYDNKYRAKIRTDTQGEGTLEEFLNT